MDALHKILLTGFFNLLLKKFTTTPVSKAEMTVPSLVPTMVKLKNKSDTQREIMTHKTSNAIFTFPNFFFAASETAFTKASPEFIMTFAMTEREIPKPRIIIPIITMARRIR